MKNEHSSQLPPTPASSRRRWRQFSLRSLLLLITLLSTGLGYESYRAARQLSAVATLKSIDGGVCDVEFVPRWAWLSHEKVPARVRSLCERNPHLFNNVESLFLTGPRNPLAGTSLLGENFCGSELAALDDLRGLTKVSVLALRLGEDAWMHLTRNTSLRELEISGDGIREAHFARIGAMKDLEVLKLSPNGETDSPHDGLRHLSHLSQLRTLELSSYRLTDEDLSFLSSLSGLEELNISYSQISDSGLDKLLPLTNLKSLSLSSTAVTDEGVKRLRNFKKLETVFISMTKVTEKGIRDIARNPQVKEIHVGPWKVAYARSIKDDEPIFYDESQP